jgi:hypothetical protein
MPTENNDEGALRLSDPAHAVKFPRSKLAMAKADGVGEILRTR